MIYRWLDHHGKAGTVNLLAQLKVVLLNIRHPPHSPSLLGSTFEKTAANAVRICGVQKVCTFPQLLLNQNVIDHDQLVSVLEHSPEDDVIVYFKDLIRKSIGSIDVSKVSDQTDMTIFHYKQAFSADIFVRKPRVVNVFPYNGEDLIRWSNPFLKSSVPDWL